MASNQVEIGYTNELTGQDRETTIIPSRAKEMVLKAGLGLTLILAMTFIALPVASLFIKSPLDVTLRSLYDPVVMDALKLSLMTSTLTTLTVVLMGTPIA